jgi:CBS domain-containing protein
VGEEMLSPCGGDIMCAGPKVGRNSSYLLTGEGHMMKVEKILAQKGTGVYSIRPNDRITDAARLMNEKRIGALMVVDEHQNIEGIVSERDILQRCAVAAEGFQETLVKDLMTPKEKLIVGDRKDDMQYLMRVMTTNNIRHIPIMEKENIVALVSMRDVIRILLAGAEYEKTLLTEYMSGTDLD